MRTTLAVLLGLCISLAWQTASNIASSFDIDDEYVTAEPSWNGVQISDSTDEDTIRENLMHVKNLMKRLQALLQSLADYNAGYESVKDKRSRPYATALLRNGNEIKRKYLPIESLAFFSKNGMPGTASGNGGMAARIQESKGAATDAGANLAFGRSILHSLDVLHQHQMLDDQQRLAKSKQDEVVQKVIAHREKIGRQMERLLQKGR